MDTSNVVPLRKCTRNYKILRKHKFKKPPSRQTNIKYKLYHRKKKKNSIAIKALKFKKIYFLQPQFGFSKLFFFFKLHSDKYALRTPDLKKKKLNTT